MATENLPISGLYPLSGTLTPNDLLVISQEKVEGWKSFNVEVSKFVDLVIEGMNDGSVFMRKIFHAENSGLTGAGILTDALSIDWPYLRTQFAPANIGAGYVPITTRVIAGNGLTGGGELGANRTLALGTPSTITSTSTNNVTGDTHTHAIEKASTSVAGVVKLIDTLTSTSTSDAATARTAKALNDAKVEKSVTITAGNGLTGGGDLSGARTISLGAPSSITENSTNLASATTHTHAIDKASTANAGVVKLNDTLTSTSVTEAPTARQVKVLNDGKAEKSTTLTVGWGLTGGGNLSANRTIDLNLTQLDTRYAAVGVGGSYVPLTRAITAGTGLTGGGDMTANRSFSVNFGTAANTVAMGNDSRIVNGQTAFGWGNHAAKGYLTGVTRATSNSFLTGAGTAASPLSVDMTNMDKRYLKLTGGTVNGDLTITGKLNAPNLDAGIPTGTILWFNCSRTTLPDGWVTLDGQLLKRADFPDLWAMINANRLNKVTEASWTGSPANTTALTNRLNYRSCFTPGDGSTTFRMADLNGKTSGSLLSPVLRGDGLRAGGAILGDATRKVAGNLGYGENNSSAAASYATGPFYKTGSANQVGSSSTDWDNHMYSFDNSRVVPTDAEVRPNSAFGVYAIKARGGTNTTPAKGAPATLLANEFNGSQKITGNLEVTKDLKVNGNVTFGSATLASMPFMGGGQSTKIFISRNQLTDARTGRTTVDTNERKLDTMYTNTSTKPRMIFVNADVGDAVFRNGSKRFRLFDDNDWIYFTWIIMPGETYGIYTGGRSVEYVLSWVETV